MLPFLNVLLDLPNQFQQQFQHLQQQQQHSDPQFVFFDNAQNHTQNNGFRVPRPPYTNSNFKEEEQKPQNLSKSNSVKKSKSDYTPQQGQYWNIEGDQAFENKDYLKAIEYYTKAIELSEETDSSFFRNRGNTYKHIKQLDLALKDAIQAIELDDKNIKAHLLCGQVMAEMGKNMSDTQHIQTSITRSTKALTLCAGQKKQYYESLLSKQIYRAKKLLWYKQQEIKNNHKKEAIQNYKNYLDSQSEQSVQHKEQALGKFIESVGDPEQKPSKEIPEYLICRITLDIMENPVVTESGLCYEKEVLEEHFKKNGAIDPTTRKPVSTKFYPNQNIKKAIEEFLLKQPWAFEFTQNEDYREIQF